MTHSMHLGRETAPDTFAVPAPVGALARRDGAQLVVHLEALGAVDGDHLDGGDGVDPDVYKRQLQYGTHICFVALAHRAYPS